MEQDRRKPNYGLKRLSGKRRAIIGRLIGREPPSDVFNVRDGGRERDQADVRVEQTKAGDDDLEHGTAIVGQDLHLVDQDKPDLAHDRLPALIGKAGEIVPFLCLERRQWNVKWRESDDARWRR